jgi:hypothetical protein
MPRIQRVLTGLSPQNRFSTKLDASMSHYLASFHSLLQRYLYHLYSLCFNLHYLHPFSAYVNKDHKRITFLTDEKIFTEKENYELVPQHLTNSTEKSLSYGANSNSREWTNHTPKLWNLSNHEYAHKVISLHNILRQLNEFLFF